MPKKKVVEEEGPGQESQIIDVIPAPVGDSSRDATGDLLAKLTIGETATYEPLKFTTRWTVRKGSHVGQSRSLDRAIRLVGAQQIHDPDHPNSMLLIDLHGNLIPPEDAV